MTKLALFVACVTVWSVAAAAPGNLDHESKGKEAESCLCPTTDDLLYVCGTDGRTCSNISELKCELTCGRSEVQLKHDGPCDQTKNQ